MITIYGESFMFSSIKTQYVRFLYTFLYIFFFVIYTSLAVADENYGNLPPDPNMSSLESIDLPFDPNDYDFLIYVPEGGQDSIEEAMKYLGISCDVRDFYDGNEVTSEDLATHDILIVGWNVNGDTSGLDDETLATGITGRVILSGHDADFHTVHGPNAAEVFLVQAIDWVLKGDGTGMITLGCTDAFPYLPEFWDVNAFANSGEDVNEFTAEGLASGVYDDLEPNDMDNWGTSYHDIFTIEQGSFFVPFELGGGSGSDIITIASDKIKLPYFYICKDDNDVDCVSPLISEEEHEWLETPYNWLYYKIKYDANGHADTNVVITDHLPKEVDEPNFISDGGVYDPNLHTVTWNNIGDISPSDSNTFRIKVAVNYYAKPGHKIYNYCEIEGDQYFSYAIEDTNVCCYGGNIIYVDEDANDPNSCNNGTSWFDAYRDLQDAFHTARNCASNQIWVAEGTYKPTKESARSISFELLDDLAIYGGFAATESHPSQRNLTDPNNETTLSGDIGTPNNLSDNSYHVVKSQDVNNAILDGFTITGGSATGSWPHNCGGGMYNSGSSPTVTNCTFTNNSAREGGAVYNYYHSDPNIINCVFSINTAYNYGGGMVNSYQSAPNIINCIFSGNSNTDTASNTHGGAICNWINSDPNVTNCTFTNNSASSGGGMYNESSDPNVNNCIFSGNTSTSNWVNTQLE
jgi:hypothetical protein